MSLGENKPTSLQNHAQNPPPGPVTYPKITACDRPMGSLFQNGLQRHCDLRPKFQWSDMNDEARNWRRDPKVSACLEKTTREQTYSTGNIEFSEGTRGPRIVVTWQNEVRLEIARLHLSYKYPPKRAHPASQRYSGTGDARGSGWLCVRMRPGSRPAPHQSRPPSIRTGAGAANPNLHLPPTPSVGPPPPL